MNDQISPEYENSLEVWAKNGRYGVTDKDHLNIGGSPPWELKKNPGKTLGELMSESEVLKVLKKLEERSHGRSYYKRELMLALNYFRSINKLPSEFESYKFEDLPDDPK